MERVLASWALTPISTDCPLSAGRTKSVGRCLGAKRGLRMCRSSSSCVLAPTDQMSMSLLSWPVMRYSWLRWVTNRPLTAKPALAGYCTVSDADGTSYQQRLIIGRADEAARFASPTGEPLRRWEEPSRRSASEMHSLLTRSQTGRSFYPSVRPGSASPMR